MKKLLVLVLVLVFILNFNLFAGYLDGLENEDLWEKKVNGSEMRSFGVKYISEFELPETHDHGNGDFTVTGTELAVNIDFYESTRLVYVNRITLGYYNVSSIEHPEWEDDYFLAFGATTGIRYLTHFGVGKSFNIELNVGFEMQGIAEFDDGTTLGTDVGDGILFVVEPMVQLELSPFILGIGYKYTADYQTPTVLVQYKFSGI